MTSDDDMDDLANEEIEEVYLKQIEGFKPLAKLEKIFEVSEMCKDEGVVFEISDSQKNKEKPVVDTPCCTLYQPVEDYDEDADEEEDTTYLQPLPDDMRDISGDGGVLKSLIKPGIGPVVSPNALCRVHYTAYIKDELEPFDSTRLRNSHAMLRIGKHANCLYGLHIGLATMCRQEEAKFLVRADYAYGMLGCPPRIPPNATILFVVHMASFINFPDEGGYENDQEGENIDRRSWEIVSRKLDLLHKEGNDWYENQNYRRALYKYGKALRMAEASLLYGPEDEQNMNDFCVKIYLNVAMCSLKMNKLKYALSMCERVLALQPDNLKAIFRMGQAYRLLTDYENAKKFLLRASSAAPLNSDICDELALLSRDIKKYEEGMTEMCKAMFDSSSSDSKRKAVEEEFKSLSRDMTEINEKLEKIFEERFKWFSEDSTTETINFPNVYIDGELALMKKIADKNHLKVLIKKDRVILSKNSQDAS